MDKITEDDLRKAFLKEQLPEEPKSQPVKIVKPRENLDELRLVRKKILKIREEKPKTSQISAITTFVLRTILIWGIVGFMILVGLNSPAFYNRFKWLYYVNYLNQKLPTVSLPQNPPAVQDNNIKLPDNLPEIKRKVENDKLKISKIAVDAPVFWDVEPDKIIETLLGGVAHYKGSGLPGEGSNIFIVGHSSNYFWIKSDYNNVFSLLDKLEKGDRIELTKDNKSYFYDVVDKRVVKPDQVEVLQRTPKETLSLMTCWPIGTSYERLVVQAQLIYSSY